MVINSLFIQLIVADDGYEHSQTYLKFIKSS